MLNTRFSHERFRLRHKNRFIKKNSQWYSKTYIWLPTQCFPLLLRLAFIIHWRVVLVLIWLNIFFCMWWWRSRVIRRASQDTAVKVGSNFHNPMERTWWAHCGKQEDYIKRRCPCSKSISTEYSFHIVPIFSYLFYPFIPKHTSLIHTIICTYFCYTSQNDLRFYAYFHDAKPPHNTPRMTIKVITCHCYFNCSFIFLV